MIIRLQFEKLGKVRFTSHRDVARIFGRCLRRAGLPLAYSQGYSPRPKLAFGLALPTGYESLAEYLDIELVDDQSVGLEVADIAARVSKTLPQGMVVTQAVAIDKNAASLQQVVTSCSWQIDIVGFAANTVSSAVAQVLEAQSLVVNQERKGKIITTDLRPAILNLATCAINEAEPNSTVRLVAELATQPRSLRVSELLAVLNPPLHAHKVCRLQQWTKNENDESERSDPLRAASSALLQIL